MLFSCGLLFAHSGWQGIERLGFEPNLDSAEAAVDAVLSCSVLQGEVFDEWTEVFLANTAFADRMR